jgi:hypothetical protein
MGGKLTRKIGIERNEAWWGLKNLTFNFLRFLQRSGYIAVVALPLLRRRHVSCDIVNGQYKNFLLRRPTGDFFMSALALESTFLRGALNR